MGSVWKWDWDFTLTLLTFLVASDKKVKITKMAVTSIGKMRNFEKVPKIFSIYRHFTYYRRWGTSKKN